MDVYRVRGMTALNSLFYRWRIKEAFTTGSALRCRADAAPTPCRRGTDRFVKVVTFLREDQD